jgi:hypothetical protein
VKTDMKNDLEKVLSTVPSYDLNDYTVVVFDTGNTSVLYQKCLEREVIRPVYYEEYGYEVKNHSL